MSREKREQFGDWKYVGRLGSGGNGEVHLWQNQKNRKKIAVKSPKFHQDRQDQKEITRWKNELAFAKQLRNDYIIHALSPEPESFANFLKNRYPPEPLVMEYCEKGDLRKKLNLKEHLNGMPEAEVRSIVKSLQSAVVFLHSQGITHRDLKPENLVIKEVNGCEVYKLTDLGFAREIDATTEASHVGTFEYFAPEVICEPSYSKTVDYWSMGVIAFEIICGTRPFLPGCRMPDVIREIRAKGSEHIAISKSNENGEIKYHTRVFDQNHISMRLQEKFESWFRSAFALDPRARSCTAIANLLSMKILTVFCLHNFNMYSYVISETTSRQGFLETLARDTKIPIEDIVIILPPENGNISRFTATNQPHDLYINEFYDKPMVYCTTDKDTLKNTSANAGLSQTFHHALIENTVKNQKHGIEVAKHMMYYIQKQGRYCSLFLEGLLNYAVMVDDWILKYNVKVEEMRSRFYQLQGGTISYLTQTEYAKQLLVEKNIPTKLQDNSTKIKERFNRCKEVFTRTSDRFASVFRRSKEIVGLLKGNYESFVKRVTESCDLQIPYDIYTKFREGTKDNLNATKLEMFRYFNNLQNDIAFIHSSQIINIQKTISEIHEEFEKIMILVDKFLEEQINMLRDVEKLSHDLIRSIFDCGANSARGSNDEPNLPDLDGIMNGLDIGAMNGLSINGNYDESFVSVSDEGQAIVDKSEHLFEMIEKMLKERVFDES